MNATDGGIAARLELLGARIAERELAALLVEDAADLRYVSGYTGSNGLALLRGADEPAPDFLTDFRYTEQSQVEVPAIYERKTVTGELRDSLPALLGDGGGRLGFDATKLTVRAHARIAELLGSKWELVPADGLVAEQRTVKEPAEIAAIAAAAQLADEALRGVLESGLVGRTESAVAFELEMAMRRLGAEQPSFPSIVAAGAHGALPHAQPREVEIPRDVLVTIDWGAAPRGVLLGLHAYVCDRRGHLRAGTRDLRARAECPAGRPRRPPGRAQRSRGRRRGARGDRRRGRGVALRARARPWRRARDPRGAAAVADGLRAASPRR